MEPSSNLVQQPAISVIIPILNEAGHILRGLACLPRANIEIIVVDGGSRDDLQELLPLEGIRLLRSQPGRAKQMNAGAVISRGRLLVFLHADTQLGDNAWQRLTSLAKLEDPLWGFFNVRLSGVRWSYPLIARMMNLRSRLTRICTGDQTLFVSIDLFKACGGFPDIALMEDIALSRLLSRRQPPIRCPETITTSSRRWQRNGTFNTILLMWRLRLAYFFGVDPDKLARRYNQRPGS